MHKKKKNAPFVGFRKRRCASGPGKKGHAQYWVDQKKA